MIVYTERGDVKALRFAIRWIGLANATFISLTEDGRHALAASVPRFVAPDWEDEEPAAFEAGRQAERAAVVAFIRARAESWRPHHPHEADDLDGLAEDIERGEHVT